MSFSISDSNLEVFRLVVDQAPDAIIFADRQGMIQVWNKAAADLFGFPADEVIGLSLDIIIPEHLRHAHWEGFGRAVASGLQGVLQRKPVGTPDDFRRCCSVRLEVRSWPRTHSQRPPALRKAGERKYT